MKLTPSYGADALISLDGDPAAVAGPAIAQRRRLADALATLDEDQWARPSRCDGWSNRDVIVHLDSTNAFWSYSIAMGVRGEPSRMLADFDPVSSPAALVAASGETSVAELLESFGESTASLEALLGSLQATDWTKPAEAPPGHISVSAVAHHALWDSWVHERDIMCPLGIEPAVEAEEVAASLRYVAALAPALAVVAGTATSGTLAIEATGPDMSIVVEIGEQVEVRGGDAESDLCISGDAVELLEALSVRRPLGRTIPQDTAWMLSGLSDAFAGEEQT